MAEAVERENQVAETQPAEAQTAAPQARPASSAAQAAVRPRRRFGRRKKVCPFCAEGITYIDYKQPEVLSRFLSERGQIWPRRKTGLCSKHQRALALAIKRARFLALLPFTWKHIHMAVKHQG
ncbi:MAG TPA: 30S ribosomal protein S18 [Caldilineae bacterium]|nr:30S ribosomal protein S18 [Caldilineae bacterium]